jgi:hypothetical protein
MKFLKEKERKKEKESTEMLIESLGSLNCSICDTQSEIYEYMAKEGYDIKTFSDAYLASEFCKREMDTLYSSFQQEFANACVEFFMPQLEGKLVKDDSHEQDKVLAKRIGYMYRVLYMKTSVPSAELAKIVPFDEMAELARTFVQCGYECVSEEIIRKHNLPHKRYDSDIKLTEEEFLRMQKEIREETERLRRENE